MNLINQHFQNKDKLLIPYICAGDPDMKITYATMLSLAESGACVIELGMPFSDPVADGPTIEKAHMRSLDNKTSINDILECILKFKKKYPDVAIILMGYLNPIYAYGLEDFILSCKDAAVSGLIIVDLPFAETEALEQLILQNNADIVNISLVSTTTRLEKINAIVAGSKSFIYYVSVTGVTGSKSFAKDALHANFYHLQAEAAKASVPVAIGFGLKTKESIKSAYALADAAIVGSKLVEIFENHEREHIAKEVAEIYKELNIKY